VQSLDEIYLGAREIADASARAAYLTETCGADRAMRRRVEAMLQDAAGAEDYFRDLDSSPPELRTGLEQPGTVIGRYKLLEKIGEGGMGVVYMAEQEQPVRRKVALKIIKLGMDTRQVLGRFEAERQALALMDHPNIAKILDGGATDTGRPFFVMDLVQGLPITKFCDEANLSTHDRLDLFLEVCSAIQHAHQKGIIHRDIKPANILVTLHGDKPVPKVIDFGIAKATQGRLTEKTLFTQLQHFIGTPAYMSPEQASLSGLDVDTRSDIYGLGVLLYELLTGRTPFDEKELMKAGFDEMRRIIRETEPPKPSTRLTRERLATRSATSAKSEIRNPKSEIDKDLDWIVMKALEKDRARRYETANGLAADLKRHLSNEPVIARPPTASYRLQKMVRRNKLMFAAGIAVATALVVGLGLAAVGLRRATQERNSAVAARAGEEAQRRQAQQAQTREVQLRQKAERQELAARQRAYGSDMNLVQQALALNNLGRAQELLNRQRPQPGQQDLRGWEWRYLWQHCQSDALFTLEGKRTAIGSLAVSADGKWLAIGENGSGILSVWDLHTRQRVARFKAGIGDVRLAFAHRTPLLAYWCGSYLPTTAAPTPIWLWEGGASRMITNCSVVGTCQGLRFSEDDQRLVTCTSAPGNELAVWRISTGAKLSAMPSGHLGGREVTSFAASQDLKVAALEADDGWIRVVDLSTARELWTAKAGDERVTAFALSPDGRQLASAAGWTDSQIRLWDTQSGKELGKFPGHNAWVSQLVFTRDGSRPASASADQTIRLWDLVHSRSLRVLRGHRSEVWRLALSADQTTCVSGAKDGSVFLWEATQDRRESTRVLLPAPLAAWCFAPDGKSLLTLDRQGHADRWSGKFFEQRLSLVDIGTRPVGWQNIISPQDRLLAVGSTNGMVQVWDLERRALLRELRTHTGPVFPVAFLAQETKLVTVHMDDNSFHEWNLITGMETLSWPGPSGLSIYEPAIFSPDEQWCLMANARRIRNMATGTDQQLNSDMESTENAAFSPDGGKVAVASYLGYARMWDTRNWKQLATFSGFLLGAHSVAFSPDGRRLAVGSLGREAVKIWDAEGLQELLTIEGKGGAFLRTSFSPDGNIVGSMNYQGLLHLWTAPTFAEIEAAEAKAKTEIKQP
jgi:WD40 repeat protein/serine/threonine protein kinase